MIRPGRGAKWSRTERLRQGSNRIGNLVVLIASMILLAIAALGLAYYVYWSESPPASKQATRTQAAGPIVAVTIALGASR